MHFRSGSARYAAPEAGDFMLRPLQQILNEAGNDFACSSPLNDIDQVAARRDGIPSADAAQCREQR